MAIPYDRIVSSPPFKFLVGPEKKPFVIHAALVTHHSKPLDVLVNGQMSEAREGCACLDDVDEDTFIRFSQYLYTGDYSVGDLASPPKTSADESGIKATNSKKKKKSIGDRPLSEPVDLPYVNVGCKNCWELNRAASMWPPETQVSSSWETSKKSQLWNKFQTLAYLPPNPVSQLRNNGACWVCQPVLLCHARLYVFAERYDISPLKNLALHRLHRTLSMFNSSSGRAGDIVELLQCSYEGTADRKGGEIDELRQLIIHYAACVIEDLAQDERFQTLLEDGGQLARDLLRQVLRRLD